jgi:hypothetical protein
MRYSLAAIETFLTVMELGTISAAAARLVAAIAISGLKFRAVSE